MNTKKVFYILFVVFLALQILFPAPLLADAIGKFNEVRGNVSLLRAKTTTTPKVGDVVQAKDVVATGDNARVKLLLNDDTLLSVGQKSNLEITEFLLEKNNRSGVISLKTGTMHTKVEKFLNPSSKFEVHTPTAVAGARGTAWLTLVELAAQSAAKSSFYALEQSVFVLNPAFPTQVATVVAGNFSVVTAGAVPTAAAAFPAAAIQGIMGQLGVAMPATGGGAGAATGATTAQTTGTASGGTAAGGGTSAGAGAGSTGAAGAGTGAGSAAGATGAGAAGAGTGAAGAAGAASAGAAAGAAVGAGVGVGTIAAAAAVAAAAVGAVAAASGGGGGSTTPTHTATTHHH